MGIKKLKDINESTLSHVLTAHFTPRKVTNVKITDDVSAYTCANVNDAMMSDLKNLTVTFELGDSGHKQSLPLFVKLPSEAPFVKFLMKMNRPVTKETIYYTKVKDTLAAKHPVLKEIIPECYHGFTNYEKRLKATCCMKYCCLFCWWPAMKYEDGILILEDLEKTGFRSLDKNEIPSFARVKSAFEALAHFSGSWLGYLNDPDKYDSERISKDEVDHLFRVNFPLFIMKKSYEKSFESILKLMRNREEPQELMDKVENYGKNRAFPEIKRLLNEENESKFSTIIHGDFWLNNIMFNKEDESVKLIDFQMCAKRHPANDIWYFLYNSTDRAFRAEHADDLIKAYYRVFSGYFDDHEGYSYEAFRKEVEEYRVFGFLMGIFAMPNQLSPVERKMDKFSDFRAQDEDREKEIAGEDKDDDHKMIREIRRRLIEWMKEADQLGMLG